MPNTPVPVPKLGRDPTISTRTRRFLDFLSLIINDFFTRGQIVRNSNGSHFTIAVPLAAPSGLEYTGAGCLSIDLATPVLTLTNPGLTFANQGNNTVLASPANGSNGTPVFRALGYADIPANIVRGLSNGGAELTGNITLAAGPNVTISGNAGNNTFTIDATSSGGSAGVLNLGNGTANATGNVTIVGNNIGVSACSTNNTITLTASPGGVLTVGNGPACATGNVVLNGNGITFSVSGNTILASVVGTGGGGGGNGIDPISFGYPPFAVAGDDDEFNDGVFSGWTNVTPGSNNPTLTETNNVLSLALPGGDAAANLHAYLKSRSIGNGSYVETAIGGYGTAQNFNICGLIMSDGTTFGSGNQVVFYHSPHETKVGLLQTTGFNNQVDFNGYDMEVNSPVNPLFLRLVHSAPNTYQGWVSPDGVSWIKVTGDITEPGSGSMTPLYAGFFVSTWGGFSAYVWSLRYCRFG